MLFIGLTLVLLVVGVLILMGMSRLFDDRTVRQILQWEPTRSPELEAQNEVDDVRQMLEAQNELRRKRGAEEITEADVYRQAQEDQELRARASGPFGRAEAGADRPPSSEREADLAAAQEAEDIRQMLEAQNELRRKRGAKEITEADAERQAGEDEKLRSRARRKRP